MRIISFKMPIKPFSFPLPETRFLHTAQYVYKFKIRYGVHFCSEENSEEIMSELLDSVRVVLANHNNLQPFSTKHFIIFPYKTKWDSASRLKFKHGQKFLQPFPYVFTIYVEPYALLNDSQVETDREIEDDPPKMHEDEETHGNENSMTIDNEESLVTNKSHQLSWTLDRDSQNSGGFVDFLMKFTPLRYLFGRRPSVSNTQSSG